MNHEKGEKILVRDNDSDVWTCRWFVSKHPFRDKVITVDCVGNLEEWFKSNKINNENS